MGRGAGPRGATQPPPRRGAAQLEGAAGTTGPLGSACSSGRPVPTSREWDPGAHRRRRSALGLTYGNSELSWVRNSRRAMHAAPAKPRERDAHGFAMTLFSIPVRKPRPARRLLKGLSAATRRLTSTGLRATPTSSGPRGSPASAWASASSARADASRAPAPPTPLRRPDARRARLPRTALPPGARGAGGGGSAGPRLSAARTGLPSRSERRLSVQLQQPSQLSVSALPCVETQPCVQ